MCHYGAVVLPSGLAGWRCGRAAKLPVGPGGRYVTSYRRRGVCSISVPPHAMHPTPPHATPRCMKRDTLEGVNKPRGPRPECKDAGCFILASMSSSSQRSVNTGTKLFCVNRCYPKTPLQYRYRYRYRLYRLENRYLCICICICTTVGHSPLALRWRGPHA